MGLWRNWLAHRTVTPEVAGSYPVNPVLLDGNISEGNWYLDLTPSFYGWVAEWFRQHSHKVYYAGSNPVPATCSKNVGAIGRERGSIPLKSILRACWVLEATATAGSNPATYTEY